MLHTEIWTQKQDLEAEQLTAINRLVCKKFKAEFNNRKTVNQISPGRNRQARNRNKGWNAKDWVVHYDLAKDWGKRAGKYAGELMRERKTGVLVSEGIG